MGADPVEDELRTLLTGTKVLFTDVVNGSPDSESYYLCSVGAIIRVLRANEKFIGTQPAYIQIFDFKGEIIRSDTKIRESSGSFFLRKYNPEINQSKCMELRKKPSFIPEPNSHNFHDIVNRREFTLRRTCLGLDHK